MFLDSCIGLAEFNDPEANVLNKLNESTCMIIEGKSSDKNSVIIKLHVNRTCVIGSEVSNLFKRPEFIFGREMGAGGHWYLYFGLPVTSFLGFQTRVNPSLVYLLTVHSCKKAMNRIYGSSLCEFVFLQVQVLALLSGQHHCSRQTFLFVNQENGDCSKEVRCQRKKGIPYGRNATLCLVCN